jgi:DNA ligase (NAD+)
MLSLDKCTNETEFARFAKIAGDLALVATPKVDGLACCIRYGDDGVLQLGATRGDGERGEDVTRNVRQIPGAPERIDAAAYLDPARREVGKGLEVRGEVYLPLQRFREVEDQFMSPRNLAAGVLKAKDEPALPPSDLAFLAYDLVNFGLPSKSAKLLAARALGFTPAPWHGCGPAAAPALFSEMAAERTTWGFEADGVVFEIDDADMVARLGTTAHHPRGAIAWKFATESGTAVLREVEWSVSRTGTITPVALFEPVALSGAMVGRATLHNLSNLRRLGLHVGDRLEVVRRGGVIPHVERNLDGELVRGADHKTIEAPDHCPSCGSATQVLESVRKRAGEPGITAGPLSVRISPTSRIPRSVNLAAEAAHQREEVVTQVLACSTPQSCTLARRRSLLHWCQELELDGFGEKVVDALIDARLANDPADLYTLRGEDLEPLPRFGKTMVQNLLNEVGKARTVELGVFLRGLGIESLGKQTADLLAARWSLPEIRALTVQSLDAALTVAKKPGEKATLGKTAQAVHAGLVAHDDLIDRLLLHVEVVRRERQAGVGALAGQVVVFTGALERMGRRDAQQKVVKLGGLAGDAVTDQTTLLVVGGGELDSPNPSSKLKKARKLFATVGKPEILDEATFWQRVDAAGAEGGGAG